MTTCVIQAVLRGGPSHGLTVTALFNSDRPAIDCVSRTGYSYRDSGYSRHGLQIYDWRPATDPPACRQVPRDVGGKPVRTSMPAVASDGCTP